MIQLAFGLLSFIIALASTPIIGRIMERRGFVGVDLHKEDGRRLPEMAGIASLLGFTISSALAYVYLRETHIILGLVVVLLVGFIGIADGIKKLKPREKMSTLLIVGLLLLPFSNTTISGVDIGVFYLIGVPLFFAIACNFTNMLAGFNGLEVGTGAIASLGIAALALLHGAEASFLMAFIMACGLLGLLYYNRYPARVFPGDVGTLPVGAVLFTAMLLGKFELFGAIVFIPHALDAALKYFSAGVMTRESQQPTIARGGTLYMPEGSNLSLPRLFFRNKPLREYEAVQRVWLVEAFFCTAAISAALIY